MKMRKGTFNHSQIAMISLNFLSFVFLLFCHFKVSNTHGKLLDPRARSSAWRLDPSFPVYHNDNVISILL